jgi:poly-gamma-glutamate capsule biosynthesis protein CapA/YwtB (metallophosphatase superfamily)
MLVMLMSAALAQQAPPRVTVLFGGDVTLGYHYEEYVEELQQKKKMARDEAQSWGFAQVGAVTRAADFFVVNLECPFTTAEQKIAKNFNFKARPELVATLLAGGVDAVSLANNHLMDYGASGLFDTLQTLDAAKIAHFGAGRSLSVASAPRIVDVKGVKVALVGFFFLGDRNIEPPEVIATASTPGVAGDFASVAILRRLMEKQIRAAKAKADHVVPFFHWGREGRVDPEPYQVELAHAAIEAGASAVIGSHPHVLQPVEVYRNAPIIYSLGNFVFGGNWDPKDKKTALFELTLTRDAVVSFRALPAASDAFPERPVQPAFVEGEQATLVFERLKLPAPDAGASQE